MPAEPVAISVLAIHTAMPNRCTSFHSMTKPNLCTGYWRLQSKIWKVKMQTRYASAPFGLEWQNAVMLLPRMQLITPCQKLLLNLLVSHVVRVCWLSLSLGQLATGCLEATCSLCTYRCKLSCQPATTWGSSAIESDVQFVEIPDLEAEEDTSRQVAAPPAMRSVLVMNIAELESEDLFRLPVVDKNHEVDLSLLTACLCPADEVGIPCG